MSIASEVARHLLQIKAIRLSPQNPFTWASGIKSPIYCDNRMILSYPSTRNFIKEKLAEKSKSFADFDIIAGVATAGIAHGMLLADALNMPFIYVRDKAKGHGRQNQIEGHLPPNSKVLVVEDLISTGGSSIKAVDALKEAGADVIGVLAIFTYGFEKADNAFRNANCPYLTLSNYDALIPEAIDQNYINSEDLDFLKNWRAEVGSLK
jgi:orotate phosphoribosyltransferase